MIYFLKKHAHTIRVFTDIALIISVIFVGIQTMQNSQQQVIIKNELDEVKTKVADINKITNVSKIRGIECPEGYEKHFIATEEGLTFSCRKK